MEAGLGAEDVHRDGCPAGWLASGLTSVLRSRLCGHSHFTSFLPQPDEFRSKRPHLWAPAQHIHSLSVS